MYKLIFPLKKSILGACEVAQWVEALAAQCGNLNSIPGAHVVGELTPVNAIPGARVVVELTPVSCDPPMCAHRMNSSCKKRE